MENLTTGPQRGPLRTEWLRGDGSGEGPLEPQAAAMAIAVGSENDAVVIEVENKIASE